VRIEQSFIPVRGVGEATERRLWERGVTDWDAFEGSVVGPTVADRIERYITEARERLAAGDAPYFHRQFPSQECWRLYENFRGDAAFFDIETTGLDHHGDAVTTVSVHRGGETTTLVRGEDLTASALREHLGDASLLVTFNGKRFDVPFLETSFDLSLDLMYPCRRLDLTGGLKAIEQTLDIDRGRPDVSGRDAVRLWREYERGDRTSLETLVEYNREDAVNLRSLADEVTARLHRRTVPDAAALPE
jgi:hypothetical protein